MSVEIEHDLSQEFATEDAAIESILQKLEGKIPRDEYNQVTSRLHMSGTVRIDGSNFVITRHPTEFFHFKWRDGEHSADEQRAA